MSIAFGVYTHSGHRSWIWNPTRAAAAAVIVAATATTADADSDATAAVAPVESITAAAAEFGPSESSAAVS